VLADRSTRQNGRRQLSQGRVLPPRRRCAVTTSNRGSVQNLLSFRSQVARVAPVFGQGFGLSWGRRGTRLWIRGVSPVISPPFDTRNSHGNFTSISPVWGTWRPGIAVAVSERPVGQPHLGRQRSNAPNNQVASSPKTTHLICCGPVILCRCQNSRRSMPTSAGWCTEEIATAAQPDLSLSTII